MNTLRMRPVKRESVREMTHAPRVYDFAAAGLAIVMALVELVRIIVSGPAMAANSTAGMMMSGIVFCLVLAATAIGMALHRQMGWMMAVLAFLWAAGHGVMMRSAGNMLGVFYVFGAVGLFVLVVKSLHGYRSDVLANA